MGTGGKSALTLAPRCYAPGKSRVQGRGLHYRLIDSRVSGGFVKELRQCCDI